ncbi:MAG: hypothetical protein JGK17_21070 [Microcoleus sp. PH2017_10_PVI_O_A]|uniref:hypothetical protein n=1 Tax=unclassified Microcoleus TaxID=2642155 RepID=UPI001DB14D55|nr:MULTISPECIES: hypothetical protein [unclassified Microcoleus]TAE80601.1 MAG: hypothetical protein EAZ83_18140 [Oscillatoriales cyanobacterium]MCC3408030.1 hypothetical protein [Microcoleus sp. PH2017_10_PVI_O_A]MCC3462150.1 hypothetical protein [Microcoleus sp. PH2017_11_PCY_U_A]MCC3480583.1 hypothetical protein [Microcoleus sp. PH2017_12_PCY_D_A]MCC3561873.1 hypothetical protein [Microcoleus sp. PH2017_27_LUM_O_A]
MTAIEQPVIKNYYDLFDLVRTRPKLYLGNNGLTLTALMAFVIGYKSACFYNGIKIDEGTPPYWHFVNWIPHRLFGESNTLPWDIMEDQFGQSVAFSTFFEILDEFRSLQPCLLASIQPSSKHQLTGKVLIHQGNPEDGWPRYVPSNITIVGYPNLPVCFISYEYADLRPYETVYSSLKTALEFVNIDINIEISEWKFTEMGNDRIIMES